ncbi:hypothetical protein EH223_01380 [candidate division KSB1 bacterium]|nr:hypothetical protein [candidate division KSB1 bacterium]RQW06853.1 MAG: hypothetical protein EH223_01380 [candidate division KSB1 bacterium]
MLKKLILLCFFPLLIFFCDVPTGLKPTQSGIAGTVFFKNEWPKQTDEVMVVAATVFPPTSLEDIIMSEPLDTFVDSANYVIWTNPEAFAAVGVVWKEKEQPWEVTNIIGIYFPTDDKFTPGSVTIPDRNTLVDSINIEADLSVARRKVDSVIEGTLTLTDEWWDGAEYVLVIAAKTILNPGLLDLTFGFPMEANFDTTTYSLPVQPGTYVAIGAIVTEKGQPIGTESIKGFYKKKASDRLPTIVKIPTDTTRISNIDITIDYDFRFP